MIQIAFCTMSRLIEPGNCQPIKRRDLLAWGQKQLAHLNSTTYLETIALLCFVLKCSHTHLLTRLDHLVSDAQNDAFRLLINKRTHNEPLAYLTGQCEFWSLPFKVTPACLIPRPETELLVEKILASYPAKENMHILDLGTGSGAIAIALSLERPYWHITATDQSQKALSVARFNAKKLGSSVSFRQGDWFEAIPKENCFHVIISNPPYLAANDVHLPSLRYEPQKALVGGMEGIEMLQYLIQASSTYLLPQGSLWLEHGFDQGEKIKQCFAHHDYTHIQQHKDLAGITRITSGTIT